MKILLLTIALLVTHTSQAQTTLKMDRFILPALKYKADALEPIISEQTVNYHFGKHLQTYINNLNSLIIGTEFENADLIEIIKKSDGAIFNNAAQTFNHEFYFDTFSAMPKPEPSGKLLKAIEKQWGSFDKFKEAFVTAGLSIFGSGWVWLASDSEGSLSIIKSSNANNPIKEGLTPLLGADVWEHAYYLDFQNRRADHLKQLWKITDWDVVETRY